MARTARPLTATEVKRLPEGRHAVGGVAGLMMRVTPAGGRFWILRLNIEGKRRELGLGTFPDVSLSQAREWAKEIRESLGLDGLPPALAALRKAPTPDASLAPSSANPAPSQANDAPQNPIATSAPGLAGNATEQAQNAEEASVTASADDPSAPKGGAISFRKAAEATFKRKQAEFSSVKHGKQWWATLEKHVLKQFGDRPIHTITRKDVTKLLEKLWYDRNETASRLRSRIEAVFAWAVFHEHCTDNPAVWKNNLDAVLPPPGKIQKKSHHEALPWKEAPALYQTLSNLETNSGRALKFVLQTAVRSQEVRFAAWAEIDWDNLLWVIPAERMKARKIHRVPLPEATAEWLKSLPREMGTDLIFPSTFSKKYGPREMSNMTMNNQLKDLNIPTTPHGLRSTFRDWAAENTDYPNEVVEMALAHTIANKVEAAYRRGDLLERRRALMSDWVHYLQTGQFPAT